MVQKYPAVLLLRIQKFPILQTIEFTSSQVKTGSLPEDHKNNANYLDNNVWYTNFPPQKICSMTPLHIINNTLHEVVHFSHFTPLSYGLNSASTLD